jgi:hypothetical protein
LTAQVFRLRSIFQGRIQKQNYNPLLFGKFLLVKNFRFGQDILQAPLELFRIVG